MQVSCKQAALASARAYELLSRALAEQALSQPCAEPQPLLQHSKPSQPRWFPALHRAAAVAPSQGHIIHIDFGFVLGKAPGGLASLEAAVPFKLTREMVEVQLH